MLYPIHYSLGNSSEKIIIHQQDDLFITHERLHQDATPTRFYQQQADTFCFILKGEMYIQEGENETVLKKHQALWLTANSVSSVTLLTPILELCFIRFKHTDNNQKNSSMKKISSGTVRSESGRSNIKTWPLWQGSSGNISLELYPAHYKETLYYQKNATQYFLSLNGNTFISNRKKQPRPCNELGIIVPNKEPRAVINPSTESMLLLSVTTSQKSKGRILLLKKV